MGNMVRRATLVMMYVFFVSIAGVFEDLYMVAIWVALISVLFFIVFCVTTVEEG